MDYQELYDSIISDFINGNHTNMVESIIEMKAPRFIDWLSEDGNIDESEGNKILAIYIRRTNHVIEKWSNQ